MFGDSFFTEYNKGDELMEWLVFVPMFGDSFFTLHRNTAEREKGTRGFSSPCLGILFSLS